MTIKRGDKSLFPLLGDYKPVNIYKGTTKLAGWRWQSESGKVLQFQNGYKDRVSVEVDGVSEQGGEPSPDAPIPINSLDKSFDIVSSVGGRNLIPKFTDNKWTISSNAKVSEHQLDIDAGTNPIAVIILKVLPHTEYTMTFNSDYCRWYAYEWRDGVRGKYLNKPTTQGSDISTILTTDITQINIQINTYSGNISLDRKVWNPKLEKRNESTLWSPAPEDIAYDTQTPTLYKTNILLSEPLRSVGNVKDRVYLDEKDGLWKVERNIREYTFTGLESWSWRNELASTVCFFTPLPNSSEGKVSSNRFVEKDGWVWINTKNESGIDLLGGKLYLKIPLNKATSKEMLNQWLLNNSTVIQYQLATPTIETLPQSEQVKLNNIQSFKGSNYVYTVANLEPNLNGKMKVRDI